MSGFKPFDPSGGTGGGGGGDDPTITTLTEGQVPKADANGKLIFSGATIDTLNKEWTFDKTINLPAGSLNIGPIITLSEGGDELIVSEPIHDTKGYVITSKFDSTGSSLPAYVDLGAQITNVLQPDDSSTITTSPLLFPIIGGVIAPDVRQTNQVTFRSDGPTGNVTAKIIDNASGTTIQYIPNKAAFDAVTAAEILLNPGLDFINGDNIVDFISKDPSTPGVFNVGITPFRLIAGQQIDIEIKSPSMSLKGTPTNIPYLTQLIQEGPVVELAGGGGGTSLDQVRMVYVAKAGSDTNSGLNINEPKLTLDAALTYAVALVPSQVNQIVIEIVDSGTYTGDVEIPSFVHVMGQRAAWDGKMRVSDSVLIHFRSAQNSNPSDRIFRKSSGTGEASITLEALFVVGNGQEGVICDAGRILLKSSFTMVDAGHAMKAKAGSEVVFTLAEVSLANGGICIGTKDTDGAGNFYSGSILNVVDDGTGILIETRVPGDEINIYAGHVHVDVLYDLGINSTLSMFIASYSASVTKIADPTATINLSRAGDGDDRQIIRSGVKGEFSVALINNDEQLRITADDGSGFFEVYFIADQHVDHGDGVSVKVPDQTVTMSNTPITRWYWSVNAAGVISNSQSKRPISNPSLVHLFEITGDQTPFPNVGIGIPSSLLINPRVTYSDMTFQATLESAGTVVDDLLVSSKDDGTLSLSTNDFFTVANGVNYEFDKLNIHSKFTAGNTTQNWTYVDSGITIIPPIGVDNLLDGTLWDNNGVLTSVGVNEATVQGVIVNNGNFIIVRGTTLFSNYDDAILNMDALEFEIPAIIFNAVLVAKIAIKGNATDSADTQEVTIRNLLSATGGAGGSSISASSIGQHEHAGAGATELDTAIFDDGEAIVVVDRTSAGPPLLMPTVAFNTEVVGQRLMFVSKVGGGVNFGNTHYTFVGDFVDLDTYAIGSEESIMLTYLGGEVWTVKLMIKSAIQTIFRDNLTGVATDEALTALQGKVLSEHISKWIGINNVQDTLLGTFPSSDQIDSNHSSMKEAVDQAGERIQNLGVNVFGLSDTTPSDMDVFTGLTISDNGTVHSGMQELETFAESINSYIYGTNPGTFIVKNKRYLIPNTAGAIIRYTPTIASSTAGDSIVVAAEGVGGTIDIQNGTTFASIIILDELDQDIILIFNGTDWHIVEDSGSDPVFTITTSDLLITSDIKSVYVDADTNPVTLTLDSNPEVGIHKLIYIGHNENLITLNSANPSNPIADVPIIAEDSVQGLWAMSGDFIDRFTTGRNLTLLGTGGNFVTDTVQGSTVTVFDTEGTAGLQALGYFGVLGVQTRSFTTWVGFNSTPTTETFLTSWGSNDSGGGLWWKIIFNGLTNEMEVSLKNAHRRWDFAALNTVNLFDGDMHHIAVTMSNNRASFTRLFIDGVELLSTSTDNNPNMVTLSEFEFGIAKDLVNINPVDARLYDTRLFDKALSDDEVSSIYSDNIAGGITLSQYSHNTVFDVVYNGDVWVVSVGVQSQLLEVNSAISQLENQPTVTQSLTAPSFEDVRFFSGFGLANTQGWNFSTSNPATITIVTETVDGIPQAVHKLFDDGGGIGTVSIPVSPESWADIFEFDASFGGKIRLDSNDGDQGCFWGLGCLAVDSPDGSPDKRRFGLNIARGAGTLLNVSGADGNTLNVDVAGSVFDEYNDINIKITRGSPPTAEVFVNGDLIGTLDFLVHTGGTGTQIAWSSGSSGATERVTYMPDFGVTVYTSENVVSIGDTELQVDNARILLPPGNRDYTFIFREDITGTAIGAQFEFIGLNTGGTFTATNENPANVKALFNALPTVTIPTTGAPVVGVNSVDGGNVYNFKF